MLVGAGTGHALTVARSVKDPVNAQGAAATIKLQKVASALAPRPEEAGADNGEIYDRDCPGNYADSTPNPCVFDFRVNGEGRG